VDLAEILRSAYMVPVWQGRHKQAAGWEDGRLLTEASDIECS